MNMEKIRDAAAMIDNLHMDVLVLEGVSNILWDSMANGGSCNSSDIYINTAYLLSNMTSTLSKDVLGALNLLYEGIREPNKKAPATEQSTQGAKE